MNLRLLTRDASIVFGLMRSSEDLGSHSHDCYHGLLWSTSWRREMGKNWARRRDERLIPKRACKTSERRNAAGQGEIV